MDGNKHIDVVVCMGSSCFARGNKKNLEFIENLIENNNLDISIELIGNRCEKKCAQGPIVIINGVIHSNTTRDKLKSIFSELLNEKVSR